MSIFSKLWSSFNSMALSAGAGPKRRSKKVHDPDFLYDFPSGEPYQDDDDLNLDEQSDPVPHHLPSSKHLANILLNRSQPRPIPLLPCHSQPRIQFLLLSHLISSFSWSTHWSTLILTDNKSFCIWPLQPTLTTLQNISLRQVDKKG